MIQNQMLLQSFVDLVAMVTRYIYVQWEAACKLANLIKRLEVEMDECNSQVIISLPLHIPQWAVVKLCEMLLG